MTDELAVNATLAVPYELWLEIRQRVLDAPCRHVDEFNSLACDDCVRIRRAVHGMC